MIKLRRLLAAERHIRIKLGESGDEVYHLPGIRAYLKISRTAGLSDLGREREVLNWLAGKAAVPKVLEYERGDGEEAILVSEIAGIPATDLVSAAGVTDADLTGFVGRVARAMRSLHSISLEGCPHDERLDAKFERARENIRAGLVDADDFGPECAGKTAGQIYQELLAERPGREDLVFTHGDLCLPNIIVDSGGIAGFIDLGRGGISDRYQDIALFLRSFRFNAAAAINVEDEFCAAYGVDELDKSKLGFYRKLDELF